MRKTDKTPSKKLNLTTQTVRDLRAGELDRVAGGGNVDSGKAGGSCLCTEGIRCTSGSHAKE
jgi:hypothetical protein